MERDDREEGELRTCERRVKLTDGRRPATRADAVCGHASLIWEHVLLRGSGAAGVPRRLVSYFLTLLRRLCFVWGRPNGFGRHLRVQALLRTSLRVQLNTWPSSELPEKRKNIY